MPWNVAVKVETAGNGDETTEAEITFDTYAEALELAEQVAYLGSTISLQPWEETGPPKWEINWITN
jgi:hypothetical protein